MKQSKRFIPLLCMLGLGFAASALAKETEEAKITGTLPVKNMQVKDYPKAARVTSTQASEAALGAVPGEIRSVVLEKEDGFLVYAVEIASSKSGMHEIVVDAGNGVVLASEHHDHSKNDESDEDGEEKDD
jgi:uncharacterized membrane protein YkoI